MNAWQPMKYKPGLDAPTEEWVRWARELGWDDDDICCMFGPQWVRLVPAKEDAE